MNVIRNASIAVIDTKMEIYKEKYSISYYVLNPIFILCRNSKLKKLPM